VNAKSRRIDLPGHHNAASGKLPPPNWPDNQCWRNYSPLCGYAVSWV